MNTKLNTDEGLGAQAAHVTRGKASERRDWFGWFGHRRCVSFLWFGRRRFLPAAVEVFVRRSLPAVASCDLEERRENEERGAADWFDSQGIRTVF